MHEFDLWKMVGTRTRITMFWAVAFSLTASFLSVVRDDGAAYESASSLTMRISSDNNHNCICYDVYDSPRAPLIHIESKKIKRILINPFGRLTGQLYGRNEMKYKLSISTGSQMSWRKGRTYAWAHDDIFGCVARAPVDSAVPFCNVHIFGLYYYEWWCGSRCLF